jgi:hypothetical protein
MRLDDDGLRGLIELLAEILAQRVIADEAEVARAPEDSDE